MIHFRSAGPILVLFLLAASSIASGAVVIVRRHRTARPANYDDSWREKRQSHPLTTQARIPEVAFADTVSLVDETRVQEELKSGGGGQVGGFREDGQPPPAAPLAVGELVDYLLPPPLEQKGFAGGEQGFFQAEQKRVVPGFPGGEQGFQADQKRVVPGFAGGEQGFQAEQKRVVPGFPGGEQGFQADQKRVVPGFPGRVQDFQAEQKRVVPGFAGGEQGFQAEQKRVVPGFAGGEQGVVPPGVAGGEQVFHVVRELYRPKELRTGQWDLGYDANEVLVPPSESGKYDTMKLFTLVPNSESPPALLDNDPDFQKAVQELVQQHTEGDSSPAGSSQEFREFSNERYREPPQTYRQQRQQGPVYTYVKTDKQGRYKWGVRHGQ